MAAATGARLVGARRARPWLLKRWRRGELGSVCRSSWRAVGSAVAGGGAAGPRGWRRTAVAAQAVSSSDAAASMCADDDARCGAEFKCRNN